jgi:hypothetical protein
MVVVVCVPFFFALLKLFRYSELNPLVLRQLIAKFVNGLAESSVQPIDQLTNGTCTLVLVHRDFRSW